MATVIIEPHLVERLKTFLFTAENYDEYSNVTEGLYAFLCNHPEGVAISDAPSFHRMRDNEDLLNSLKGAGVDNWEGYDFALEEYWANKEED